MALWEDMTAALYNTYILAFFLSISEQEGHSLVQAIIRSTIAYSDAMPA